jgi:hypothetical protein
MPVRPPSPARERLVRRVWAPAALVLAVAVVGMLLLPVSVARVVTADGDTLACRRLGRGDAVTLVFTHSMYGGEVRETWRVDGGTMARQRIVTDNAAAAEYYATDGETRPVAGGYEVIAPPLRVRALPFRIDQVGRHRLRIGDGEISLADRVDGSIGATLSAAQVPLVARLIDPDAGCD